jgi:glycosyltransferase involved in cell wall biosynthesis
MRVLQLIDSLNAGGAEKMAVQYANSLLGNIESSHLCATRKEGILKNTISPLVGYLYLNKKSVFDRKALRKLSNYVEKNSIDVIHAHTTSYFFAVILKLTHPKIRLIWHEHHGNRIKQKRRNNPALFVSSFFFNAIFTVNEELLNWCKQNLATRSTVYVPNFVDIVEPNLSFESKKHEIVCVANFRVPKNHMNLLTAFELVHRTYPSWKLVLIGRLSDDSYSEEIRNFISSKQLSSKVRILGEISNVSQEISKASIGVLSSDMEGLPVALLEYGASKLAVVSTDIGQCREVIQSFGKLVPPKNAEALSKGILYYIENSEIREADALKFSNRIKNAYTFEAVLPKVLGLYKKGSY